jgi:hypothetical protein
MANRWVESLRRYGGTTSYMLDGTAQSCWAQIDADHSLTQDANSEWMLELANGPSGYSEARRVFGAALTEVFIGCGIICDGLPATEPFSTGGGNGIGGVFIAKLRDVANNTQLSFYLGTDGGIVAWRGGELTGSAAYTGTVLGRTVPCIGTGGRHHIEIYAKAHASAGAIEVRVDEVTRLNLTGINTLTSGNVEFSQWAHGHDSLTTMAGNIKFRDFFVNDTTNDSSACDTFVGDCKAGCLMVNADTAQADFAKSTGIVGFSLLNETPPNDTTAITRTASTGESDFGLENPPSNTTEILTARPWIRASKDDAGTCVMAPNMKSGATKGTVSGSAAATAAGYLDSCVPIDPAAVAPWTLTTLSAALHVVERTS